MTDFKELVELARKISMTTSRNEKIELVSSFIKELPEDEVRHAVLFLLGRTLPPGDERHLDVNWRALLSVLKRMTGADNEQLFKILVQAVDIGDGFKKALEKFEPKRQSFLFEQKLTIKEVSSYYNKIASLRGAKSRKYKEDLLFSLFSLADKDEAEFLARNLTGEMRIGLHEGLMEEAIAKAFQIPARLVRRAVMLRGDISEIAVLAKRGGAKALESIRIEVFRPLKPMLATDADSIEEVLRELKRASFEFKLDGIRLQMHAKGGRIRAFTRRLSDVTQSLPDIVDQFSEIFGSREVVADGEAIAIDPEGRPLPFQFVSRRLRRKSDIARSAKEIPLRLFLFDILQIDGKMLIDEPYFRRRKLLEDLVDEEWLVPARVCESEEEASNFLKEALDRGHEGLIAKKLDSIYTPGVRGKNWFKIKPVLATLDLVIVAAERGYGRRHKWLSDYYLAARDEETGEFYVVGKTFKGLTDQEFELMTQRLKELAYYDDGHLVKVKPSIVVEVAFNEIQKSPKYESGLALRFARIVSIREDKTPEEAETIQNLRRIYEKQFLHKGKI
ncbi:MAG: DNA ligase [Thermoproteota archaeon]|nr:MAG: DNA ligase [Candidatus Korarchaeota archaeon]